MVLPAIRRPRASIEKMAASAAADRVAGDFALDRLERDAVAAGIDDLAIGDAQRAALGEMQQPAPFRQRDIAAVENEAGDADMIAAGGRHDRRSAGHDDPCRAGNAGDGGVGRQRQRRRRDRSRAAAATPRRAAAACSIARCKDFDLIVGRVRPQAERDGIDLGARRQSAPERLASRRPAPHLLLAAPASAANRRRRSRFIAELLCAATPTWCATAVAEYRDIRARLTAACGDQRDQQGFGRPPRGTETNGCCRASACGRI